MAFFLITGGIIFLSVLGFKSNFPGLTYDLYAVIFSMAVLVFMIGSGAFYLASSNKESGETLMIISLFIQAFPFSIFGITVINFFGAFIGVELSIVPAIEIGFRFQFLSGLIQNGIHFPVQIFYLCINVFPLLLIWLMRYLTRREKRVAQVKSVLESMTRHGDVNHDKNL